MSLSRSHVANRYQLALSRIAEACRRAGRSIHDVSMVGVTKYVGIEETRWLAETGCLDLGESRPQMLWEKAEALSDLPIRWHLIGHLQRNKVARTLRWVHRIHSVDSDRLLKQIVCDCEASPGSTRLSLLIEVNISRDSSKTGLSMEETKRLLQSWVKLHEEVKCSAKLQVDGLMGMGTLEGDEMQTRQEFASLRLFREECQREFGLSLPQLSMGMSSDFEWAIEEGATLVRLGSTLFSE